MSIRPDWAAIADSMPPDLSDEEQQQLWLIECKKWLGSIADEFGGRSEGQIGKLFNPLG